MFIVYQIKGKISHNLLFSLHHFIYDHNFLFTYKMVYADTAIWIMNFKFIIQMPFGLMNELKAMTWIAN